MKKQSLTFVENLGFSFQGIVLGLDERGYSGNIPRRNIKLFPGERTLFKRKIIFSRFFSIIGYIETTSLRLLIYKRFALKNDEFYSISWEDVTIIEYTQPSFWDKINQIRKKVRIIFKFKSSESVIEFYGCSSTYSINTPIFFGLNATNYSSNTTAKLYEQLLKIKLEKNR